MTLPVVVILNGINGFIFVWMYKKKTIENWVNTVSARYQGCCFFYVNSLFVYLFALYTFRKTVSVHAGCFCLFCVNYLLTETIYFFFASSFFCTPHRRSKKKPNTITMHLFIVSPAAPFICICRLCSDNMCTLYTLRMAILKMILDKAYTHWR